MKNTIRPHKKELKKARKIRDKSSPLFFMPDSVSIHVSWIFFFSGACIFMRAFSYKNFPSIYNITSMQKAYTKCKAKNQVETKDTGCFSVQVMH